MTEQKEALEYKVEVTLTEYPNGRFHWYVTVDNGKRPRDPFSREYDFGTARSKKKALKQVKRYLSETIPVAVDVAKYTHRMDGEKVV